MNVTPDQQAKLGATVADLKTRLHDVEGKITHDKLNEVNWDELSNKLDLLHTVIQQLFNAPVRRPAPPDIQASPAPMPTDEQQIQWMKERDAKQEAEPEEKAKHTKKRKG